MVVRIVPCISGWRAIAWIALPTTRPMPMPGPMAAAPYTIPAPMDCRPSLSSPACWAARSSVDMVSLSCWCEGVRWCELVIGVERVTEVDRGEQGEDVRLQEGDE